jgi:hypothetical protein
MDVFLYWTIKHVLNVCVGAPTFKCLICVQATSLLRV